MNVGDILSDNTCDRLPCRRYDRHFSYIHSRINDIHQLSRGIERERKKNKIIVILIGILVLVAEVVSIITKLTKE